ncbi:MAG: antirestriction protein, partial [Methylophilales bacterium 16-45-9]
MTHTTITRQQINDKLRIQHTADLFGILFPLSIEPAVYSITSNIASEYNGAYWEFYSLSNGGFYMAPSSDKPYQVSCENGFEGTLSADALGITACLYAY